MVGEEERSTEIYRLWRKSAAGSQPSGTFQLRVTESSKVRSSRHETTTARDIQGIPYPAILASVLFVLAIGPVYGTQALTFGQALQQVINTYPSLQVAQEQVQKARLERGKVESQLGWVFGTQADLSHDLSQFGIPANNASLSTSLNHGLASGGTFGITGSYSYSDSTYGIPGFPNPIYTGRVDLNLNKPLRRGAGNPDYKQGLINADANAAIARANARDVRDQLAQQTMSLFYGAALTWAQLENARDNAARAKRLLRYVRHRTRLGLAENKDLLQSEAQWRAQNAQVDSLLATWENQRTSLNQLMGRPAEQEFLPVFPADSSPIVSDVATIYKQALACSPDLERLKAQLQIAKAEIARRRDAQRSQLNLVLDLGAGNLQGSSAAVPLGTATAINQSDYVASVKLQYQEPLDRRGVDAALLQAELDRSIAQQQLRSEKDTLHYNIVGLLGGLRASRQAVDAQRQRVAAERKKLANAEQRYRSGRADTTEVIQFENDLFAARLALEQQQIELIQKRFSLELLGGSLWNTIRLPAQYQ